MCCRTIIHGASTCFAWSQLVRAGEFWPRGLTERFADYRLVNIYFFNYVCCRTIIYGASTCFGWSQHDNYVSIPTWGWLSRVFSVYSSLLALPHLVKGPSSCSLHSNLGKSYWYDYRRIKVLLSVGATNRAVNAHWVVPTGSRLPALRHLGRIRRWSQLLLYHNFLVVRSVVSVASS